MRVPVVSIAAAFAGGILLSAVHARAAGMPMWVACALGAMCVSSLLLWRKRVALAFAAATIAWIALGGLAASIERADVPANHVTRLIAAGQLDTSVPLRWQGRLREDPMSLPWGHRFEIDLEQVELGGIEQPVRGGLRLNLYGNGAQQPPGILGVLRAGDRVEALAKARQPRNFLDPGAFDERDYLARQGIDLTGSLRSGELLQLVETQRPTLLQRIARARGNLLARLAGLFPNDPERAAVLRAMLLGDKSFVDSEVVTAFQKTASYHVLVVAGLHVGALVVFLFWLCRKLRFSVGATSLVTLAALVAYALMVQDRTPILRASLMAAFYLCSQPFFRRIDLLNSVALAALAILLWRPSSIEDSGFVLSFLAASVIAGLALPWMDRTSALYHSGLRHFGDVTRDGMHSPKVAQFRIEMRMAIALLEKRMPRWLAPRARGILTGSVRATLRLWEIVVLSFVIQWGMSPLLAQDFHRVSLAGPISNIPAVLLTGLIVPLGFLALAATFLWARLALVLAKILGFCTGLLLATVEWFSRLPRTSYRIPDPPIWLMAAFFATSIALIALARSVARKRAAQRGQSQPPSRIDPREWATAAILAAFTVLVASYPFAPKLDRGKLAVNVLDVGQGDSIFASFPGGHTMLIDGGGLSGSERVGGYRSGMDVGEEVVSPYLWSRGLKRIDVVALTHAHHDHLDGLLSVLQNFKVGELWIGRGEDNREFRALLAEARSRGVPIVQKATGDIFRWNGVDGRVLWPPDAIAMPKASNDDSLVMRLSDGNEHFLLTGDIEQHVEAKLVSRQETLASDFLKVPHHGSKTSSTAAFLSAVAPRVAVFSVGRDNSFGQPAEAVVERYQAAGVRLLRTDEDGMVTAETDGQTLSVRAYSDNNQRFRGTVKMSSANFPQ
jgi:competence protein ComEC